MLSSRLEEEEKEEEAAAKVFHRRMDEDRTSWHQVWMSLFFYVVLLGIFFGFKSQHWKLRERKLRHIDAEGSSSLIGSDSLSDFFSRLTHKLEKGAKLS